MPILRKTFFTPLYPKSIDTIIRSLKKFVILDVQAISRTPIKLTIFSMPMHRIRYWFMTSSIISWITDYSSKSYANNPSPPIQHVSYQVDSIDFSDFHHWTRKLCEFTTSCYSSDRTMPCVCTVLHEYDKPQQISGSKLFEIFAAPSEPTMKKMRSSLMNNDLMVAQRKFILASIKNDIFGRVHVFEF